MMTMMMMIMNNNNNNNNIRCILSLLQVLLNHTELNVSPPLVLKKKKPVKDREYI